MKKSISMPYELYLKVKARADEQGMAFSEYVRNAVETYVFTEAVRKDAEGDLWKGFTEAELAEPCDDEWRMLL